MTDETIPRKLTPKQTKFVQEYLINPNATQAAIKAGYSKHTAKDIACENLAKPNIRAAIDAASALIAQEAKVTATEVLNGLRSEAQGKKDSTSGSRVQAWAHLGKHLQLFEDRSTFDGKLTIEIVRFGEQAIECEDVESIEVAD